MDPPRVKHLVPDDDGAVDGVVTDLVEELEALLTSQGQQDFAVHGRRQGERAAGLRRTAFG